MIEPMQHTAHGMKREAKNDKLNYLDYLDPYVLGRYARHMKKNEHHGRGNWKKGGYPLNEYLESMMRHLLAAWALYEATGGTTALQEDHLAALMFNVIAFMLEERQTDTLAAEIEHAKLTA